MRFLGDFQTTDTVYCYFATVQATGAPTTLSGTPKLRCYKAGSTTESSDLTPTVDFDSRTGLNLVSIDLTGDSGFYAAQNDYNIVITAGTVNSVSAVGYVVGTFSVRNRAAITNAIGPIATATTQTARDLGASVLVSVGTGAGQLNVSGGKAPATIAAGDIANSAITAASIAADAITAAKIADGAIDAATFAAGAIDATAIATDAIGSAEISAAAVTKIQAGLSTYAGGAVASVTGNVGGNVVGSVASVTAGVTVTTNNDKTGYGLSAAAVQAIWDALTSALTTVGSIGKWIVDKVDVVVSTRLATSGYTAPLDASGVRTAVGLASANLDTQLDALPTAAENATAVWAAATRTLTGSQGVKKNTAKPAFMFLMTDSTNHLPATGLTVTATRSLDGAAFASCANSVSEVASGWYKIDLAAADLNGDTVALKFTATAADALNIGLVTGA